MLRSGIAGVLVLWLWVVSSPAFAELTATLDSAGGNGTELALSYTQHNAGSGNPYGSFTVDVTFPADWTPATDSGGVSGCPVNVPAHVDLQNCEITDASTIRLALTDRDRDTAFPDVAELGTVTFGGTGGSLDTTLVGLEVVDARDSAGHRDDAGFDTQVVAAIGPGCAFAGQDYATVASTSLGADQEILACVSVFLGPDVETVNDAGVGVIAGLEVRIEPEFRIEPGSIFAVQVNP